jgi:FkbM family methyltransferase
VLDIERYFGAQTVLGQIVRAPLRRIPRTTVVRVLSGPLRGRRWIVGSGIHRLWLGAYEPAKMKLAADLVKAGDTVFDIGAHVGVYSLLFSECVGPAGRVVAFEPLRQNVEFLRAHLRLNEVSNVQVVEAAVCDRTGPAAFDESVDTSTGHLSVSGRLRVMATTVDEFGRQSGLVPRLVKMDVEGAEADVLSGSQNTLQTARPIVLLATHGGTVRRACEDLLRRAEYRVVSIPKASVSSDELLAWPN